MSTNNEKDESLAENLEAQHSGSIINRIVRTSVDQPFLVLLLTLLLVGAGIWSLTRLPVDAYPDISPPMVEITTQWPGHAAEEVERLITVPLEVEMNGLPGLKVIRSVSLYGLSSIRLTFKDGVDNYFVRQQAFERLPAAELPDDVDPEIDPLFSPSGLVYRYVLDSPDRSSTELKNLNDWVISRMYKSVPGVADESGMGGATMQYQVLLDPAKLAGAQLTVQQVMDALGANNGNAGGGFYSEGGQFFYVRGLGRMKTLDDIGNVVVKVNNGIPVLIKDLGDVVVGSAPKLGNFGFNNRDDAVEGVILLRKGEQTQTVLKGVEAKTRELNQHILPKDVKIHPFYDRSDLVKLTERTVANNLLRGILLVIIVLIFFLYDVRSGLIVAATIPGSLLFAFICLDIKNIPANLLSIGAIDFGILVEGAVIMAENIYRQVTERAGTEYNIRTVIVAAAAEVDRPIVYAIAVIVATFAPIFVLSGPSGLLFRPMAYTTIFALIGSLMLALSVVPVLCSVFMRKGMRARVNPAFEWVREKYARGLDYCMARPRPTLYAAIALFIATMVVVPFLGAEFMPKLDEGALWVRATMPYTISLDESSKIVPQVRSIIKSFPQVVDVASEHGRPDDGTDPTGFFNAEFFVGLKPYREWTGPIRTKPALIAAIDKKLSAFPGITFNYTQPAEDAVDEAETGLKSALDVKIFGPDLNTLEHTADAVKHTIAGVRGIQNITVVQELGQPALTITVDRAKIARYGVNVADINGLIEAAVGGAAVSQIQQGERVYDLVVRLAEQYRQNPEQIGNILVPTPDGQQLPLRELADIQVSSGASFIYRQDNSRFIGVQYSVEGRDMASAVADAQKAVQQKVQVPPGYRVVWGGEYEEYTASRDQLKLILPLTLLVIFLLLFALYNNFKFPLITVAGVLLSAPVGGVLALLVTGTPLSVSSGIGFLALFGVAVQTAVVYISYANELRAAGYSIADAARRAALLRLRAIMMTALVAALGLLPAALATGVGSDTQRPFATVIVGGLIISVLIGIFLVPVLYVMVSRESDVLRV